MCLGIPGKVIEIHDEGGLPMGVVDFGGVRRAVCLAYVRGEVGLNDYVIVHVGMALSKIAEEEAQQVFAYLRHMESEESP